jgi:hypothetical protein
MGADSMTSFRTAWAVSALAVASSSAFATQPFEGTWASKPAFCGADLSRAVNNSDFPLVVTEQRVDWALNRCTVLKRSGRTGIWQVRAKCEANDGGIKQDDFALRVKGNRLTIVFADGTKARYVRCKQTANSE